VALAVAPLLIVPIAERFGWRMAFLILGIAGLSVSLPLAARYVHDAPASQPPRADDGGTVRSQRGEDARAARKRLWLYIAAGACNAFCVFGILNWLPSYLNRTRGIEFGALSLPLFSVFLAGIVGVLLWAMLGDHTGRRMLMASVGLLLASGCVLLTAYVSSNTLAIALLALGVFFQSSYNAQEFATLQQMAHPTRVGALTGLYNGTTVLVGGVGGSLVPGAMVALTGDFQKGLLSVAAGALTVCLLMAILSRTEHMPSGILKG
ncbi:MAG: MFS transporter, partial [Fimbriimonadales bacterium]